MGNKDNMKNKKIKTSNNQNNSEIINDNKKLGKEKIEKSLLIASNSTRSRGDFDKKVHTLESKKKRKRKEPDFNNYEKEHERLMNIVDMLTSNKQPSIMLKRNKIKNIDKHENKDDNES